MKGFGKGKGRKGRSSGFKIKPNRKSANRLKSNSRTRRAVESLTSKTGKGKGKGRGWG